MSNPDAPVEYIVFDDGSPSDRIVTVDEVFGEIFAEIFGNKRSENVSVDLSTLPLLCGDCGKSRDEVKCPHRNAEEIAEHRACLGKRNAASFTEVEP